MVRPLAHVKQLAPVAHSVPSRVVSPLQPVPVDAFDDLQDIRECLQDLVAVQRRILDEVRRRAATRPRFDAVISGLTRATASLLSAIEPAETDVETICWECNRPIVPGRLANPADVKRHLVECEPRLY